MKKYYINKLNEEELKKVFENNEEIQKEEYNDVYENNMNYQLELGKIFFGNNSFNYLDIRDYYSSFYLKVKDPVKLFENLSINNKDYLNEEDGKKYELLYKKAKKQYNYMNKCNYYNDNYYKHYEILEKIAVEIVEILENKLHKLENIENDDIIENFIFNVQNNNCYDNIYILNKKDFIAYENIKYIRKLA